MLKTELNIESFVKLSHEDISRIHEAAYADAVMKLMDISDSSINEFDLNFSYEIICKVSIKPKPKY